MASVTGRLALICACVSCVLAPLSASNDEQSFDVAAVKQNRSGDEAEEVRFTFDGVRIVNVPLRRIVQVAFNIGPDRLIGGPMWMSAERFDIVAKSETDRPLSRDSLRGRLQSLLRERFSLKTERRKRGSRVFALTTVSGSKLGPQLQRSARGCDQILQERAVDTSRTASPTHPCGIVRGIGRVEAHGLPLTQLAGMLRPEFEREVVDKTGLEGDYDWSLHFTPRRVIDARRTDPTLALAIDDSWPAIEVALREQLGLKATLTSGDEEIVAIVAVKPLPEQ